MITVYHGSNVLVREPLVGIGRENLDFGLGFYVTVLTEQADIWAGNMHHETGGGEPLPALHGQL